MKIYKVCRMIGLEDYFNDRILPYDFNIVQKE